MLCKMGFDAFVTGGEKILGSTGIRTQASGIPSLHSTTELPKHMSICLTIYHQKPLPDYIAIHLHLSVGQTSILHTTPPYKDLSVNPSISPPSLSRWTPNETGGEKISGSTGIQTQGVRNTVSALYQRATEPHVDLPHDISRNT